MAATYGAINPADLSSLDLGWRSAPTQSVGGVNLYRAYQQQEAQKQRMANESERQMKLQTQMMQSEFDAMKAKADTSGQLAAQFLTAWGSSLNDIKGMYGDAASVIKSMISGESGGSLKPQLAGLQELSSLMKQEYTSYKELYAPMEKEFMTAARDTAQEKRAIQREIAKGGGAWTDTEGAAARAKTDTAIQGELANQAEARKLLSLGIDPSSGRFGALTRKGAIDLAGETVRAMNLARQTEKTQGLARATAAASALNPDEYSRIGTGIRTQGTDILRNAGALEQAGAGVQSQYLQTMGQLGSSYANMAGGMARDITNPLAEMAGYYSGMSGGSTGAINLSSINPVASYGAITKAPTAMQGNINSATKSAAERAAAIKNRTYGNYNEW